MDEKGSNGSESEMPLLGDGDVKDRQQKVGVLHPKSRWFRYFILVLICILTLGSYFVYDIPGAIPNSMDAVVRNTFSDLKDCHTKDCDSTIKSRVGLFYTVYSLPNTVLCFFGGIFVDKLGIRSSTFLFALLILAGQAIFSFGGNIKNFWVMLVGRFVFGLGGESLSVAQSTYTARWYSGHEMAFAFGIQLSVSRIGSSINYSIEPSLNSHSGLGTALWFGTILCGVSLVCCLALNLLDMYGAKKGAIKAQQDDEEFRFKDIFEFPFSLWLIFFVCVTFYIGVFVFLSIFASQLFQDKWGLTEAHAGFYVALPYTVSAIVSPFLGFLVDYVGRSLIFMLVACFALAGTHLSLYFIPSADWSPLVAMLFMGVAYSVCAAAIWPCVALITPSRSLGTAYGLMTAIQNAGLAAAPAVMPWVKSLGGSEAVQVTFASLAGVSFLLTLLLIVLDYPKGQPLNGPGKWFQKKQNDSALLEESGVGDFEPAGPTEIAGQESMAAVEKSSQDVRMTYYQRIGILHAG